MFLFQTITLFKIKDDKIRGVDSNPYPEKHGESICYYDDLVCNEKSSFKKTDF